MAIHRGIQSAVFYYLSCAPCVEARYRKQRKEERLRGRIERQILEAENPNLYRQPSPSSTNPHWQSEIALGPALTHRGRKKNNTDGRAHRAAETAVKGIDGAQSSMDLSRHRDDPDPNDTRWNFRLYQREDEELWGSASNHDGASSLASSLPRPKRVLTQDSGIHSTFRNPPVNDMHPATFTKIDSPEEALWMLQPPPPAEIMRGKERVCRSRSDSGESRVFSSSSTSLARQLSARMVQNRLRTFETSSSMSRESSSRNGNPPYGQRYEGSGTTSQRDFAVAPVSLGASEIIPPSPVPVPRQSQTDDDLLAKVPQPLLGAGPIRGRMSLQHLSAPCMSDDTGLNQSLADEQVQSGTRKENRAPSNSRRDHEWSDDAERLARQYPYVMSDASLKFAGDTTPRNLHGKVIRPNVLLDGQNAALSSSEDRHLDDSLAFVKSEPLDAWYRPDFELDKWVHETTKREVTQRWSMDL